MLIAANYHYVRESFDAPYPSIFGSTPAEFIDQLDGLGLTARFLSLDDVVAIIDGKQSMPKRAAVITFDDGFKEQFELAWPILQRKGIPAILFVNTKPIEEDFVTTTHKIHILRAHIHPGNLMAVLTAVLEEREISLEMPSPETARAAYKYDEVEAAQLKYFLNHVLNETQRAEIVDCCFDKHGFDEAAISRELYMTKGMVVQLARAHALGTHGHAHLPLGLLDEASANRDFDLSVQAIKTWTGYDVQALSYPFGFPEACSENIAKRAQSKHVRFAFTMERAANEIIDAPYFMSRFSSSDLPTSKSRGDYEQFWQSLRHAAWFRPAPRKSK